MTGIDTNVFVYACDKRDPRLQGIAKDLIHATRDGVLLWQVACEFIAASRKLRDQGFSETDAWQSLAGLLRLFPLILPNSQMLIRARVLHTDHRCSFWDAMLLSACLESGVTRLYTQDVPSRAPDGLEIINPFG